MESQKTLEDLARQMDDCIAEFDEVASQLRALEDVQFLVSFDDLRARFGAPRASLSSSLFNAVRA